MTPVRHQAPRYLGCAELIRTNGAAYRRGPGPEHRWDGNGFGVTPASGTHLYVEAFRILGRLATPRFTPAMARRLFEAHPALPLQLTMHPSKSDMQLLPFKSTCPVRVIMRVFCARPLARSSRHTSRPSPSGRLISKG
jgi:hypothetical protein